MYPSFLSTTAPQLIKASLPSMRVADYIAKFGRVDIMTGLIENSSPI